MAATKNFTSNLSKANKVRTEKISAAEKKSQLQKKLVIRHLVGISKVGQGEPALMLEGLGKPHLHELSITEANNTLEIPDYQRDLKTAMINEMTRSLQAGGKVGGPIHLAKRLYSEYVDRNGNLVQTDKSKLYIMDGLQRTFAHLEAKKPVLALIYNVESYEAERQAFVIFNRKIAVNPSLIVWNMIGPTMDYVRGVNQAGGILEGRINYKGGYNTANINVNLFAKGLAVAMGVSYNQACSVPPQKLIPMADAVFNKKQADYYSQAIKDILPTGPGIRLNLLTAVGFGVVLAEKRKAGEELVLNGKQANNLRKVNWNKLVGGSYKKEMLPVVLGKIRKLWQTEGEEGEE